MSIQRAVAGDTAVGAGAWLAEEVRGTVLVRAAGEGAAAWQRLQTASPIAGRSEIATGSDGTAVLDNGVDHIRLSPNSRLVLPATQDQGQGLLTIIEQSLGRIFFDVGHRPERSFEVDSPYLVVLVKGTHFVVNATYLGDSVTVTDGTVEVRRGGGNASSGTLIAAGQTASIRAGGSSVTVGSSPGGPTEGGGSAPGKGGSEPALPQLRNANPQGGGGEEDGGGGTGGEQGGGSGGSGSGSGAGSGSGSGGGNPGDGGGDPGAGGGDPGDGDGGEDGGGHGCGGSGHDHHHSHRERGA